MTTSIKRILQWVAAALAVLGALGSVLLPTYVEVAETSDGQQTVGSATALEVNGAGVLIFVAIPVVITMLPLFARGAAWQPMSIAAAALLALVTVLASASIGWAFAPAMVAEIAAACLPPRTVGGERRLRSGQPSRHPG